MAGRRAERPRTVAGLSILPVDDPLTARALKQVEQAVQKIQAGRDRAVVSVDLALGTNKIRHGLGRPVLGFTLTPTVANASLTAIIDRTNPHPELEVWITVAGAAQPDATVEVF